MVPEETIETIDRAQEIITVTKKIATQNRHPLPSLRQLQLLPPLIRDSYYTR